MPLRIAPCLMARCQGGWVEEGICILKFGEDWPMGPSLGYSNPIFSIYHTYHHYRSNPKTQHRLTLRCARRRQLRQNCEHIQWWRRKGDAIVIRQRSTTIKIQQFGTIHYFIYNVQKDFCSKHMHVYFIILC